MVVLLEVSPISTQETLYKDSRRVTPEREKEFHMNSRLKGKLEGESAES